MTEFNAQKQDNQAFESLTDQDLESVSAGLLLPPPFGPILPIFPIVPLSTIGDAEN
ncbi:hypothetical protein [Synechococcus sp. RS9916]|uniref:hypothetical protein n=1 Tax=Synechococcus sp. RS9916 TaxID=221359 RepID=UPI0000E537AC|nr:hypothetical protein [Synechococcus sp. RS9916]EAU74235.1 hypothetical protein RS9916_32047 [Synechococcus sp. RS9916]